MPDSPPQTAFYQSGPFLAAIVASTSDAILSKDLNSIITSWNPGAERMFGYTAAEAIGQPVTLIFPPDLVSEEPGILARIRRGEVIEHYETLRQRKDGKLIDISLTVSPIRAADGTIIGASKIARDITLQKQGEKDKRASSLARARLAAIIESSDDAIIGKDLQGIVTSWNAAAEEVFGYTAAEMLGHSITRLIPPERLKEEPEIIGRFQRGDRVRHLQTVRQRKDGKLIHVSLTISPIRDADGVIIGASKIARDVTELRETQEKLERHAQDLEIKVRERTASLENMVSELEAFSYSLSHDLRAPLRAIHSFTEIVLEESGEKLGVGADYLRRVINSASRMDRLIQDVLSFSRLARTDIVVSAVEVETLVRQIIEERPQLAEPAARITLERPLLPVLGHEASLTQCLTNLVDNAVKFVRAGQVPEIRIYTLAVGDNVRICVRDNGIGIEAGAQQRLFAMFQRLVTLEKYPGTGVGLAIVRKAAERMNGRVGVESLVGQGSTFWIELPAARKAP
jgi:PAS domain S-box-containing protein